MARLERTAGGELLAAWAFSAAAGTVALLGGAGMRRSTLLVILLAGLFTLATAVVHCHLYALRKGGARKPRQFAFALGAAMVLACLPLSWAHRLPWSAAGVFLPMTLAALRIWLAPPQPRDLKSVGWAATACALAGGALAVFGLW